MSKSISQNCLDLIKKWEGCYLTAYQDSVGVWTIGYGTTNADKSITDTTIKKGLKISQKTADKWLKNSLNQKYLPLVLKYNSKYNWNQNQLDALVSFAYNIGSIDQLTANGSRTISQISSHITAYNKAGGRVLTGLTNRRKDEKALFDKKVAAVTSTEVMIQVTADKLNIRSGAGTSNKIIGTTSKNSVYISRKQSNGWYRLESVDGWVAGSHVKKITSFNVKITADKLNIRKGAGTKYSVVGAITKGNTYAITDISSSGNWYKLKNGKGWIAAKFCKVI